MTVVISSLAEGLTYSEDPRTTVPRFSLTGMVQDLDEGTDQELLVQAYEELDAVGFSRYSSGLLTGITSVYGIGSTVLLSRSMTAFPPYDTNFVLNYGSPIAGTLLGPVKLDIGTTLQQGSTAFNYANLALPWTMRTRLKVTFDSTVPNGAPSPASLTNPLCNQSGTVPFYFQQPSATFTTTLPLSDYNVGALSTQYSGCTNSAEWYGEAIGSLLCMAITGSSDDGEITDVTRFVVNRDIYDYWMPYLQYIEITTGRPPLLSPGQLQNYNGIINPTVQGSQDFNDWPIYTGF
jgi:hypothetical protein